MFANINQIMLELVNAIGVSYKGVIFIWRDFSLRDIQHALPPINNFPLLNHAGNVAVARIHHFTSFFVVFRFADTGFWRSICIALVGAANLLLIETRHFHHFIQRLYLIIFRLITLISLILINCFISLNTILAFVSRISSTA